jgi:hypothetical protein
VLNWVSFAGSSPRWSCGEPWAAPIYKNVSKLVANNAGAATICNNIKNIDCLLQIVEIYFVLQQLVVNNAGAPTLSLYAVNKEMLCPKRVLV